MSPVEYIAYPLLQMVVVPSVVTAVFELTQYKSNPNEYTNQSDWVKSIRIFLEYQLGLGIGWVITDSIYNHFSNSN